MLTFINSDNFSQCRLNDFPFEYVENLKVLAPRDSNAAVEVVKLGSRTVKCSFDQWECSYTSDPMYLLDVADAVVVSRKSGADKRHAILFENGAFLEDSVGGKLASDLVKNHPYVKSTKGVRVDNISFRLEKESVFLISSPQSSSNYYHWFAFYFQTLIFLDYIKRRTDCLVLTDRLHPYQRKTLEAVGLNLNKVIEYQGGSVLIKNLLVPSTCFSIERIRSESFSLFDKLAANMAGGIRFDTPRRLYVMRGKTHQRKVINEAEIISLLQRNGFYPIDPGSMDLSTQIHYFQHAEHIVAPHGAALTNLVFCKRLITLFECFSENWMHGCYRDICAEKKIEKYFYSIGPSIALGDGFDREADFLIEESALRVYLSELANYE